jgi:hypothetical protein
MAIAVAGVGVLGRAGTARIGIRIYSGVRGNAFTARRVAIT